MRARQTLAGLTALLLTVAATGLGTVRAAAEPIVGGPKAHLRGAFGPIIGWPLIPLHAMLMPDGRVLSYGTDEQGQQTGLFVYDIWDPSRGTGADSHFVLPNTTGTDLFCSAQTLLPTTGEILLAGGDETVDGERNYGSAGTTVFDPSTDTMRAEAPMAWRRWYPTLVTMASGDVLVVGGRDTPTTPILTPELYTPGQGWRALAGARSSAAFGASGMNWWYPRAFLTPRGRVAVLTHTGGIHLLNPSGNGGITGAVATIPTGHRALPAVMYAPGKVLSVRSSRKVALVDLNPATPTVSLTGLVSQGRLWSNATVMADGRVVLTGGSTGLNQLTGVAYHAELWSPASGAWTRGASAQTERLYHSISLLLPDGTVLTGGGGAPGPATQLNAEIYYPPYLFRTDGSGQLAARPAITAAPTWLQRGQPFTAQVGAGQTIRRVTLVRTGSVTHSLDADQRHLELPFSQAGSVLTVTAPASGFLAPPGAYLLFAIDAKGVPSVGRIVSLGT